MSTPTENTNSAPAPAAPAGTDALRVHVIDALRKVYDPEIPVNVYDLGLIYDVHLEAEAVKIKMTLNVTQSVLHVMVITS